MSNDYNDGYKVFCEKNYGTVRTMIVIQDYIYVLFQNDFLNVYALESRECLYDKRINRNAENWINVGGEEIKIIYKEAGIEIQRKNRTFYGKIVNGKVRLEKILNGNMLLNARYDSKFWLQDFNGKIILEGKHNNWISDGIIINNYLITVGFDGVVKKWNVTEKKCEGVLPIKKGWITALQNKGEIIYIGTQYGQMYEIDIKKINQLMGCQGAVWNIYKYKNYIYTVSEDGKIVKYDEDLKLIKEIQCSLGWINALQINDKRLIAVTSLGEIIELTHELNINETLAKTKLWINNLAIVDDRSWFVTAEGKLGYSNSNFERINYFDISKYQLIDVVYDSERNQLIVIDVEGNIFFINSKMLVIKHLGFSKCHFTSMCMNEQRKMLYISTLEGIIISISLTNFSYRIRKFSDGRLWKIVWNKQEDRIVVVTTEKKVMLLDCELEWITEEKKESCFLTTCSTYNDDIFAGDDKGTLFKYKIEEKKTYVKRGKDIKVEELEVERRVTAREGIVIYIDSSDENTVIYRERDELLVELCGKYYDIVDVKAKQYIKETVIKNSGWNKFPQILINGHFISSASVLPHMFETGTLRRLLDNLSRD